MAHSLYEKIKKAAVDAITLHLLLLKPEDDAIDLRGKTIVIDDIDPYTDDLIPVPRPAVGLKLDKDRTLVLGHIDEGDEPVWEPVIDLSVSDIGRIAELLPGLPETEDDGN